MYQSWLISRHACFCSLSLKLYEETDSGSFFFRSSCEQNQKYVEVGGMILNSQRYSPELFTAE